MQAWGVLKAEHTGKYLNSPKTWIHYGVIEDDSAENAIIRACFLAGSSEVRIVPLYEYGEIQDGD